jgi:hypothetical protein
VARAGTLLALIGLGAGCEPPPGDLPTDRVELDGEGRACLFGAGDTGVEAELVPGEAASAAVVLEGCASGCAQEVEASCVASVSGSTVVVQARGSYRLPPGSPTCPAGCVEVRAACEGPILGAGTFTLVYGEAVPFLVPSVGPPPCSEAVPAR